MNKTPLPLTKRMMNPHKNKRRTNEEIAEIVNYYLDGATYEEIEKKYKVASSTFKHWCNKMGVERNRRSN